MTERIMNINVVSIVPMRVRVMTSLTKSVNVMLIARKKKNASSFM